MNIEEIYKLVEHVKNPKEETNPNFLPICNDSGHNVGYLKPITTEVITSSDIVALLTKWRSMFKKFFLTQFNPSEERTQKWLEEVVIPSKDRILFIICTDNGKPIGNFGLCNINPNSFELDNLIRGEKGGEPQLIYYAEISLLRWAFLKFNAENAVLHVFSNNSKTIALHQRVGFEVIKQLYLRKEVSSENSIIYQITENTSDRNVDFTYLEMSMSKNDFFFKYPIRDTEYL